MATERVRDFAEMVEVRGLRELQRDLRRADPELGRRLQQTNKRLVQDVARDAASRFYDTVSGAMAATRTGPVLKRRSGKGSLGRSRDSIKASASGREARIRAGGARAPGFFGHEFGGSRGLGARVVTSEVGTSSAFRSQVSSRGQVRSRTRQFPVHLGREGYALYPTVRRRRQTAYEEWDALFDEVMAEGPVLPTEEFGRVRPL